MTVTVQPCLEIDLAQTAVVFVYTMDLSCWLVFSNVSQLALGLKDMQ